MKFVLMVFMLLQVSNAYSCENEQKLCVVAGASADSESMSSGEALTMAMKTARLLAYEKMAERIKGVIIKSQTKVRGAKLTDARIQTLVSAKLTQIQFEKESVEFLPDGSPWAEVTVSVLKHKRSGFQYSQGARSEQAQKYYLDMRESAQALSPTSVVKAENGFVVFKANGKKQFRQFREQQDGESIKPVRVEDDEIVLSDADALRLMSRSDKAMLKLWVK